MIAILSTNGSPLNPTNDFGKLRILLKNKQAKIYKREPMLTIQLTDKSCEEHFNEIIKPLTLGIDCGYSNVGFSVISETKEIIGGELKLRDNISNLITNKKMYRSQRRSKLRYRKSRFDNRKINAGWLAPSIQNKLDSHIKLIDKLCKVLPIERIIIESAAFDIQKINDPNISGELYQQGERYNHIGNVRQYVLERDGHKCQNPNCKNKSKNPILETHHIIFKNEFGGSDKPNNFLTLCIECHKPENHKKGGFLYEMCMEALKGKLPKFKQFKGETFMSIINKKIIDDVQLLYPTKTILKTFGYVTKTNRIGDQQRDNENNVVLKVDKTHRVDAFYIAGGSLHTHSPSSKQTNILINRRNNRSLQGFRDSTWIDSRTGEIVSGQILNCGRRTRNKNQSTENLKKYRYPILKKDKKSGIYVRSKITTGNVSIRKQRHQIQKGDLIEVTNDWSNKDNSFSVNKHTTFISGGIQNEGAYVLYPSNSETKRYVPSKICKVIRPNKGFEYSNINKTIILSDHQ